MDRGNLRAVARVLALTVLAVALWALAKYGYAKPQVLGENAATTEFSAGRAYATLGRLLGGEKPHPVSSDENAAVRARIQAEFAKLGVTTSTYTAFACNGWRGVSYFPCATVTDIIAQVVPGEGRAIVLLAHYDSVPAGPGASDDQSGVATVLETARALRARAAKSLHPVLAVITDGEEAGLLGAQAFLENPSLKARVGAVINVEARGTRGRSLLFQTSPGDSRLIDRYARSVSFYSTSSLFAEIYRLLPNDTDLTLFIKQGFPSFNFAFSENVADYHTPLDRRENLSRLTLQEQGDNMLGVAATLEQTRYSDLKGGDELYLDLFGAVLPRISKSGAPLLAWGSFACFMIWQWRARHRKTGARDQAVVFLLAPALVVAAALAGYLLHFIAQMISGQPDPSYAYPIALREGLAFGVLAATLLVARVGDARQAARSVWMWFLGLSLLTMAFLPGVSPYFLFPTALAALGWLALAFAPEIEERGWGALVFAAASLVALFIWMGLAASGETLMGLKLHPLFTVPAAFAAMTLVPLLNARAMPRGVWLACVGVAAGGALVASIIAGLQPAFSRTMAQRLSIRYVEDAATKKARWALDAGAPLPPSLRAAADFAKEARPVFPGPFPATYDAPAGAARLAPPVGEIVSDEVGAAGRRVTIALHGSPRTALMAVLLPKSARVRNIVLRSEHLALPADFSDDIFIVCESRDCAETRLTLDLASRSAFKVFFGEERYSLPPFAARLVAARPKTAVASQSGDVTMLANRIDVPAR